MRKDRCGTFKRPSKRQRIVAHERAVYEEDEARPGGPHARAQIFHGDAPFRGSFGGEACEPDTGRLELRRDDRSGCRSLRRAQLGDRERVPGAESDEAASQADEKE